MIICRMILKRDDEKKNTVYEINTEITDLDSDKEPYQTRYDTPLAKCFMKAIEEKQNRFYCNEHFYTIINHILFKQYNKYNPFYIRRVDFSRKKVPPRIVVYAQSGSCWRCKRIQATQDIEEVRATLLNRYGIRVENINLHYCRNCHFFFIDSVTLDLYNNTFGTLLCNPDYSFHEDYYGSSFNNDSVLSRNGYKADGSMSSRARQAVIAFLLENGIATKSEIITLLSSFIRTRGERCPNAYPRWEEDLRFVNNYRIQDEQYVGTIKEKQDGSLFFQNNN